MTRVPSTTANAISTIRSRNGNAGGSANAAASETMPRMPDHEMTRPLPTVGRSIGRGGLNPNRLWRHRTTALKDMCQASRTTIDGEQHRARPQRNIARVRRLRGCRESAGAAGR